MSDLSDCDFWIDFYTTHRPSGKSRAFWLREKKRLMKKGGLSDG